MTYIYNPTDPQKEALYTIQDRILESFNEQIAHNLPRKVLNRTHRIYDPKEIANLILKESRPEDIQFMD